MGLRLPLPLNHRVELPQEHVQFHPEALNLIVLDLRHKTKGRRGGRTAHARAAHQQRRAPKRGGGGRPGSRRTRRGPRLRFEAQWNANFWGGVPREALEGGGGSGTRKFVYPKWPDQIS